MRKAEIGAVLGAGILLALSVKLALDGDTPNAMFTGLAALCVGAAGALNRAPMLAGMIASIGGVTFAGYLSFFNDSAMGQCTGGPWDCIRVTGSSMGQVGGIPTAVFAFGFYVAMTAGCFSGWRSKSEAAISTLTTGAALAAGTSAYMAYFSKTVLDAWCLFCVGLYGVAGILAIAAIAAKRHRDGPVFAGVFEGHNRATWTAFPAGFIAFAVGAAMNSSSTGSTAPGTAGSQVTISSLYEPARAPVALSGNEPTLGRYEAEWLVVEFADFNCGHCAIESGPTQDVVSQYDNAKLIHKNYAFLGEGSELAAQAATCAEQQNRGWDIAEHLFNNAPTRERSAVDFIAITMTGLDSEIYGECMSNPATAAAVVTEREAGTNSGVEGTPTLFVNLGVQTGGDWIRVLGGSEELNQILDAAENGLFPSTTQSQ